ncbi:hypothetical protein GCM10022255_117060 [Dactylosporangium darangshiense]|uniref:Uncharacterized protein n=1 Tax=Dactylosporangium darangshiense TaxID=579108 RepID=A0ABP8DWE9_9ACTN
MVAWRSSVPDPVPVIAPALGRQPATGDLWHPKQNPLSQLPPGICRQTTECFPAGTIILAGVMMVVAFIGHAIAYPGGE